MSGALIVARRELSQLFHSALAYVFLIVFVVFVQLFPVLALFKQGTADLRMFFDHLPWGVVLFAAFVTMRSWAEERQENTYEMLLTFPLREIDLVLGKFLAAYAFLCAGIACTFVLPLAISVIGDPDPGPIASGYLGSLLLAAMWCAAGVFVSGLSRSQLLAVIVSAFAGILSLVLGTEIFASLIDSVFTGLGSFLEQMVGGWSHYAGFSKGVIELADVTYFVAWTVAFLWLNHLFIGLRRTPGSAAILAVGTPLALGCAMLVGRLSAGSSWMRQDTTADGLYTLSPATVRILSRAQVPLRVTYYVSPREEMPKEYQDLERQVMDRLRELEVASRGKLVARATHAKPENLIQAQDETAADEEDPEKALAKAAKEPTNLEKRLSAKGVKPFPVSSLGKTETSTKLVYSTLAVRYREKDEEYLQPILPGRLSDLEYLLANTVARLVRVRPPKIALHLGQEPMDPELRQMYQKMGQQVPDPYSNVAQILQREKFDVQRVALSAHEPMPDDYDALLVIGPTGLDERQQWEIDRALVEGRPTLVAAQRFIWQYQQAQRGLSARPEESDPGVDAILEAQGLGISRDLLMDENHFELQVKTGGVQDLFGGLPVRLPTHVLVKEGSMNKDSVVSQRLSSLVYLWGTGLRLDDTRLLKNGLSVARLFDSGPKSWTRPKEALRTHGFSPPKDGVYDPQPLCVHVKGQFRSAYEGKERPAWPMRMEDIMQGGRPRPAPPDPPATAARPAPGQLILLGCSRIWQNGFSEAIGDAGFLLNCVDALTLDEDLLLVRSKQATDRRFNTPSDSAVILWTALPLGVIPLVIAGCGLFVWVLRTRRRESWEADHRRSA